HDRGLGGGELLEVDVGGGVGRGREAPQALARRQQATRPVERLDVLLSGRGGLGGQQREQVRLLRYGTPRAGVVEGLERRLGAVQAQPEQRTQHAQLLHHAQGRRDALLGERQ